MIRIVKIPHDVTATSFPLTASEQALLRLLSARAAAVYPTPSDLNFELRMRDQTLAAARALNGSGAAFATFETSRCNPEYWRLESNGAFQLRADRTPADAIRDIFENGPFYGFECATAIVIVFYKAALESIGEAAYNRLFAGTTLFHWNVDRDLGLTTVPASRFVPGDALYFDNPDVDPATMQWQGENVIYMGGGSYYGHGVGITDAASIIAKLHSHRKPGAAKPARLLEQKTYPDYVRLSQASTGLPGTHSFQGLPVVSSSPPFQARFGESLYLFE
jgi:protein-glutamine gamma-glutamyltransferase